MYNMTPFSILAFLTFITFMKYTYIWKVISVLMQLLFPNDYMSFTTLQVGEKHWMVLSFINALRVAPFKTQLNILWEEFNLWTSTELRTYGNMWRCAEFDLRCWHQQLALIYQINPTTLLTEQYWPEQLTSAWGSVLCPSSLLSHTAEDISQI